MNSFLKNFMYFATTALIFAVPVLLTLSFCLGWHEASQAILFIACLFDFLVVLIFVIAFAEKLE